MYIPDEYVRTGTSANCLELREVDDLVQVLVDVAALEPVDRRVQVDVLDPGELGVEAGADLDQRADAPADRELSRCWARRSRRSASAGRLARAVPADDPERLTAARCRGRRRVSAQSSRVRGSSRRRIVSFSERLCESRILNIRPSPRARISPACTATCGAHLRARSRGGPRTAASPRGRAARRAARRRRCRRAAAPRAPVLEHDGADAFDVRRDRVPVAHQHDQPAVRAGGAELLEPVEDRREEEPGQERRPRAGARRRGRRRSPPRQIQASPSTRQIRPATIGITSSDRPGVGRLDDQVDRDQDRRASRRS